MPISQLFPELCSRIHGGVNFTTQFLLRALKRRNHFSKRYVPNKQEIHITAAPMLPPGERPVNESKRDVPLQWKQGCSENIDEPSGL